MCYNMLSDPSHLFRHMWAAESWGVMTMGPACWDWDRYDRGPLAEDTTYFWDIDQGRYCQTNWYTGNWGRLGRQIPTFSARAPALLGFDEDIDDFCDASDQCGGHAYCCVRNNLNILSIYGDEVPYNICRNLEWQVCAAQGLLPGQRDNTIVFARAPSSLAPDGSTGKPLGQCRGWFDGSQLPKGGVRGYATDDIFYLEVCLFSQICLNGDKLFQLQVGEKFHCDYSHTALKELESFLTSPREPDLDSWTCD
jgi:hypothetical protein